MNYREYHWLNPEGIKIFARSWMPDNAPTESVVLFIHGLGEHSGRYQHWAELFIEAGYSFLIYDQRGHGHSEGRRGHTRSLGCLLNDVDFLYEKSDELFPGQKKILYGHSMGGNLALNYIIRFNRPVSALIITSPWLKLYKEPGYPTMLISGILKHIVPCLTLSNKIKAVQLTHDPVVVREYEKDPLVHDRISLKMFHELYNAGLSALKNVFKINYPLLLMHGSADTITSPKASETYLLNTNKKAHLKLWENQYHELHNELIQKDVFKYIVEWLRLSG